MADEHKVNAPARSIPDPQRPTPRDRDKRTDPRPELDPTRTQDAAGHRKHPGHVEEDARSREDDLSGPEPVSTDRSL